MTRAYASDGGRSRPDTWLQRRNSLRHDIGPDRTPRRLDGSPSPARRACVGGHCREADARRPASPPRAKTARTARRPVAPVFVPARIGLVIVTYNSADVLDDCLESLDAGAKGVNLADVVVVDNASRDESQRIAQAFHGVPVRTLQTGRNAGYAAGSTPASPRSTWAVSTR